MKKLCLLVLLLLSACSSHSFDSDFGNNPQALNAWSAKANIQQLCDGLFTYQEDGHIVNRILMEFNRRNVSYLNCRQYKGPK